jgi:YfiH family protein
MKKPDIVKLERIVGIQVLPPGYEEKIRCLFSTRRTSAGGAALDFDHRKGDNSAVGESYDAAAAWFGVPASSVFVMRQVHGGDVTVIREIPEPLRMRAAITVDATVTDRPGLVLTVLTADCLPILMADRKRRVAAAVHAGWRSTAAGIAQKAVTTMAAVFGSEPGDIFAALGPCIGRCCYEVGPEVIRDVREAFPFGDDHVETKSDGKGMLDLVGLNRGALVRAGLSPDRIWSADLCTYCREDLFYSYRREGEGTGRMLAGIMIEE